MKKSALLLVSLLCATNATADREPRTAATDRDRSAALATTGAASDQADPAGTRPAIASHAELVLHLATHAPFLGDAVPGASPFAALPDRARGRFVDSLKFHPDHGMVGGQLGRLSRDLTQAQATALLALFGTQELVSSFPGWLPPDSAGRSNALAETLAASRYERASDELDAMESTVDWWQKPQSQRAALMHAHVRHLLVDPDAHGTGLGELSPTGLDWYWEIVRHIGFYANDAYHLDQVMAAFKELAQRNLVRPRHVVGTFEQLLAHRRFDDAAHLAGRYPDAPVETVPTVVGTDFAGDGIVVYRPREGDVLVAEKVDLARGRLLVGMVHPSCGFARHILDHLAEHPELLDGVSALWIDTVNGRLGLSTLLSWNQANPALAIAVPHAAADWPFIEGMATPQLYLLQDGVLVEELTAWSDDATTDLVALLARARTDASDTAPD